MTQNITICPGQREDAEAIIRLYKEGSGRQLDLGRLVGYLASLPSAVAYIGTDLAGFAFCTPFAPDIVELGNIFVADTARSCGIGTRLVQAVEAQAGQRFHSIILSNSMHYKGVPGKRPATEFYLRLGYELIWSTGPTNVFAKRLGVAEGVG